MARDLHDRLVNEGVLHDGACEDPGNLEAVVDAVFAAGGVKADVVSRLPKRNLRLARPNAGHKVLAALMCEGAVGSALTINFDLAVNHALTECGAKTVDIVEARREHRDFGTSALIYLHGCANSPDEDWVLTSSEVERGWEDGWKDLVVRRVAASPVIVVAGIGTLVGVLLRSLRLILETLPENAQVYCVEPTSFEDSGVAESLDLAEERYIQLGWCEFSERFSQPVYGHQMALLTEECEVLARLQRRPAALVSVLDALAGVGLTRAGQARSRWFLEDGAYLSWNDIEPRWVAELVTAVAFAADATGGSALFEAGGDIRLIGGEAGEVTVACIHGKARLRWPELELHLEHRRKSSLGDYSGFDLVVVAGVEGMQPSELTPPADLLGRAEVDDILEPAREFSFFPAADAGDLEKLRAVLS